MLFRSNVAEPLLDEMLTCVEVLSDAGTRKLIADDFQDVKTILKLRKEVLAMHIDFFTQE